MTLGTSQEIIINIGMHLQMTIWTSLVWVMFQITLEIQASLREDQLFVLPNKVNYQTAINLCKEKGMNLVKIQDEDSNQVVYNFAVYKRLGQYWIDANDIQKEGQWKYSTGEAIVFSKWYHGEPTNSMNEDCVHGLFYPNGFWNDVTCNFNYATICYEDKVKSAIVTFEVSQLVALPNKASYKEAIELCEKQNLNLIKIQNEAMNNLVLNFAIQSKVGGFWIDGNDMKTEGEWVYNDNSKIVYSKWSTSQPDNFANEDCIQALPNLNNIWNDFNCETKLSVICYREKQTPEKKKRVLFSFYVTDETGTYDEAQDYCKQQKLQLVSIANEKANKVIHEMLKKKNVGTFWLDGNDRNKTGQWTDTKGNPLLYKNFSDKSKYSVDSNCITFTPKENDRWDYTKCDSINNVICF